MYETDVPDEVEDRWVAGRAGRGGKRASNLLGVVVVAAFLGLLATLSGLCYMTWAVWFCVAGATSALASGAWLLSRSGPIRAVVAAREEYEKAYPSYVLHLE